MVLTKTVAKALVVRDDQVLLLRRSDSDTWRPGKLDLAGGAIEEDEDIIEGLLREIAEETGLSLTRGNVQLAFASSSLEESKNMNRLYFVAYDQTGIEVSVSSEHSEASWMSLDLAIELNDHPIQKAFLNYIKTNRLLALSSHDPLQ